MESLVNKAIKIAREIVAKEAPLSDKDGVWVSQTMTELKQSGLTGLVVPKEQGGHGEGLFALTRICEELGYEYSSAGLCFGMHCVGTAVIASKATDWQKDNYLQSIAAGNHITTLALSEAGTGAHFYFPQTTLVALSDDEFLVNGNKTFVTNGTHADSYVVSTIAASEEATAEQFSCVLIDSETPGMLWGREWDGLGMRGNSSRALKITNLQLPGSHILGEKGDQLWYVFNVVAPYFLSAMAGTYLGIASRAFEEAKATLSKRLYTHSGASLSQFSLLQHRLGTLWARLESTRRLIYHAAQAGDEKSPSSLMAILAAKAEVAGCAVDLVNETMTLAGGIGYQSHSYLAMLLRDARAAHVMSPTTDLLYTWLGRTLLDQPILSD